MGLWVFLSVPMWSLPDSTTEGTGSATFLQVRGRGGTPGEGQVVSLWSRVKGSMVSNPWKTVFLLFLIHTTLPQ